MRVNLEQLENYMNENDLSYGTVDVPHNKDISEVKRNIDELAQYFSNNFIVFRSIFKDAEQEEIVELLESVKEINLEILRLESRKSDGLNLGKTYSTSLLREYVLTNYDEIMNFIELCEELN